MTAYISPDNVSALLPFAFEDKDNPNKDNPVYIISKYGAKAEAIKQQLPDTVFADESFDEVKLYPTNLVSFRHTNYAKKRLKRYSSRIDLCRDFRAAENKREQREQQILSEKKVEFADKPLKSKSNTDSNTDKKVENNDSPDSSADVKPEKVEFDDNKPKTRRSKNKSELVSDCPNITYQSGHILDQLTGEILAKSKSVKEFNRAFRRFIDKFLSNVTVKNSQLVTVTSDRKWSFAEADTEEQAFIRVVKAKYINSNIVKCVFAVFEPHKDGSWHIHFVFCFWRNLDKIRYTQLKMVDEWIKEWWADKTNTPWEKQVLIENIKDAGTRLDNEHPLHFDLFSKSATRFEDGLPNNKRLNCVQRLLAYFWVTRLKEKCKRLKYYVSGTHVLREYGNLDAPTVGTIPHKEAERLKTEIAGTHIPAFSEIFLKFDTNGTVVNVSDLDYYYTTYEQISQVASLRNIAENIEHNAKKQTTQEVVAAPVDIAVFVPVAPLAEALKADTKVADINVRRPTIDDWIVEHSPYMCEWRERKRLYGHF